MESSTQMKCGVCFESYTTTDKHIPMSFACGHTYCYDCVQKIENQRGGVTCPSCRAKSVPVKNVLAIEMLEKLDNCTVVPHTASSFDTIFYHQSKKAKLLPIWDDDEKFEEVLGYSEREESIRGILAERFFTEEKAHINHGLRMLKVNASLAETAAIEGRIADLIVRDSDTEASKSMDLVNFFKSNPVLPAYVSKLIADDFRKKEQKASMAVRLMKKSDDFVWNDDETDDFDLLCEVAAHALSFAGWVRGVGRFKPVPFNFYHNYEAMMKYTWSQPRGATCNDAVMNMMLNVLSVIQKDVSDDTTFWQFKCCSDTVLLFLDKFARYGDEYKFSMRRGRSFIDSLQDILEVQCRIADANSPGVMVEAPDVVKRCLLVYNFCASSKTGNSTLEKTVVHKVSGIYGRYDRRLVFLNLMRVFKGVQEISCAIVQNLFHKKDEIITLEESKAWWNAFALNVKQGFDESYYFILLVNCFCDHALTKDDTIVPALDALDEYVIQNGLVDTFKIIVTNDDEIISCSKEKLYKCFKRMLWLAATTSDNAAEITKILDYLKKNEDSSSEESS